MIGFPSFHAASCKAIELLACHTGDTMSFRECSPGTLLDLIDGSAAILLSVEVFYVLILIPTYLYVSVQIEKHLPIKLLNVPWLPGGDCTYFYFKFHNCQSHIHIYWLTYLVLNDFRTLNALYHASLDEHVGVELSILTTRQGFDHNLEQYSLARTQRFV